MKKRNKILFVIAVTLIMVSICSVPAFALTEEEVEAAVNAQGRDAVTGNIFVWFLCAIAFLKVSQKIDSFLAGLGINVGHTGGSMMAEALIATRGAFMAKQFAGRAGGTGGKGASSGGGGGGFMKGGLAGVVSRNFSNNAVKKATGNGGGGLGGKAFTSSVSKGGSFANSVIGRVATGNISSMGTISGAGSSEALMSYLGYTALGEDAEDVPSYSNVEIGGGRIMATETSADNPGGIDVGMYNTEQYMAPSGEHTTITAADGTSWYKQYAQDSVERTPYTAPNGAIGYHESIVKKLPDPPRRKDRV